MKDQSAVSIPHSLAPCFQEYAFEQLDPVQHRDLAIERVLAFGNRQELRWLFDPYAEKEIASWVRHLGARRLPWRRYNLWCVLLGLPPAQRPKERQIWPY